MTRSAALMVLVLGAGCSGSARPRSDGGRVDAQADVAAVRDATPDATDATDATDMAVRPGGPAVAFQVDVGHTGNQTDSTLIPPLTRAWSVDFGDSAEFVSYPLIADGRVFVTASTSAGANATLRALDLATGHLLWGPLTIGGVDQWSNAAYDEGRVYVVISSGLLTAFDAATGATIWSTRLPGQNDFSSPPTATGGMVFLGGAGLGGTLYAVDGSTGTVRWTAPVMGGDVTSPALSPDAVFVSYNCVQAYAFARSDGTPLWHHEGECSSGAGGATPVLWQGNLWARDAVATSLVLDATNGAALGPFNAAVIPAFSGERGFVLTGDGTLQAVDAGTRAVLWSFTGDGALVSAPLVVNGVVYIASRNGQLDALDPATGAVVWSDTLPWEVFPSGEAGLAPVVAMNAGGHALVVPAGNHVVCYR